MWGMQIDMKQIPCHLSHILYVILLGMVGKIFWLTTICIRNHAGIYGYVLQVPINFHICYTFCLNCGQKELGCTTKVSTHSSI